MLAIDFDGSNLTLTKPENMTDEQCGALKAYHGKDAEGVPFFMTCWLPNKEDVDAIKEGRPVWLMVVGNGMPPVSLQTLDQEGNWNV